MIVESHNHLRYWSADGAQSREDLIETARSLGCPGVIITDHYDFEEVDSHRPEWRFNPRDYFRAHLPFRKIPQIPYQPGNEIGFLIGIEVGYHPARVQEIRDLLQAWPFDQIIMSLHSYVGIDPYEDAPLVFGEAPAEAFYPRLIEMIAESAELIPETHVVGHYDFFSRYAPQRQSKMLYAHAPEAFDHLFRIMIRQDQALEINTGTVERLRKRGYQGDDALPDPEIIARYRELGGELITVASDAHHPRQLGRFIQETCDWLLGQGVETVYWYETGQPRGMSLRG